MFVPLPGTGDLDPRRNIPGEAALTWWQFVPFLAGLALSLWRIRNPAYNADRGPVSIGSVRLHLEF
jgi:hypothetical protein